MKEINEHSNIFAKHLERENLEVMILQGCTKGATKTTAWFGIRQTAPAGIGGAHNVR